MIDACGYRITTDPHNWIVSPIQIATEKSKRAGEEVLGKATYHATLLQAAMRVVDANAADAAASGLPEVIDAVRQAQSDLAAVITEAGLKRGAL